MKVNIERSYEPTNEAKVKDQPQVSGCDRLRRNREIEKNFNIFSYKFAFLFTLLLPAQVKHFS